MDPALAPWTAEVACDISGAGLAARCGHSLLFPVLFLDHSGTTSKATVLVQVGLQDERNSKQQEELDAAWVSCPECTGSGAVLQNAATTAPLA